MSYSLYKTGSLHPLGELIVTVFAAFRLIKVQKNVGEGGNYTQVNNFTLNNLILKVMGPLHERTLTIIQLSIQVACSGVAFFIRYQVSKIFYY